jgi:small GTP-binding protein
MSDASLQTDITLKIIILGSSEVGKTCILNRYFKNEFKENPLSTIGIDFQTKFFKFEDKKIKVNYTDTAGQEKFRAISVNYLKGTNGVILAFDITNKESFDLLESWMNDLKENNKIDISKVLIGNKLDLGDKREVDKEEAEKFAEKIGCKYFEGSAKTGENINEALDEIARITYLYMKDQIELDRSDSIVLRKDKKDNNNKKKFC